MVDRVTRFTKVADLAGAAKLKGKRGIEFAGDVLDLLPRKYLDRNVAGRFADFAPGDAVALIATVTEAKTHKMRQRKGSMLTATIVDADGTKAGLVFFNTYVAGDLKPGTTALFMGTLGYYKGQLQLAHPSYSFITDTDIYPGEVIPIYPVMKGVNDLNMAQVVRYLLDCWDDPDPVPAEILHAHGLVSEHEAYRMIHRPIDKVEPHRGRRRLRYDEALVVQTALAARRAAYDRETSTPRRPREGGLLAAFDARLPFELTAGQREVGERIAQDMAGERPMHRLLQGEVGSGKTIVALRAMLAAVDSGAQAALLAPTEVLAGQHDRSIRAMLGELAEGGMLGGAEHGTKVALLTGSMSKAARERALLGIVTGEAGIVIGTHALIQQGVDFDDLGLVVVDEQHRFGVEQRDALRGKATHPPHVLVMTATPIPRTVAMTVFGDMETSALTQLPAGRAPIVSHVVPAAKAGWLQRTWQRLAEEVAAGHQGYVVCPRIGDDDEGDAQAAYGDDDGEESEKRPLHGVVQTLEQLRAEPALAGVRLEMLHGRMPAEEKDAVMQAFGRGEIDVLVSTTVIEVGVDVPNATAMVILDADRFGISQLHQLRGRVGRGSAGGLCLLVTDAEAGQTYERLEAVAATTDGFELADLDLSLRREGDILGANQSGRRTQLRLLRLSHPKDVELIEAARDDATRLIAEDPDLSGHPALKAMLARRLDDEQAAFLERG
ncbi:ATP-dependent DNA helicase RecG [Calidifontibacter sp. DB0510]|uniref:Probable DNA 3'-5' helicase RecG n=1 Tax=Metallococcus carri TaxID=1656884 RepID=A0A967E940_9MICO|nr:ATP-dependent DNA helicase RecG [Metallococcus carri]NHN54469.1 ATP-dependent DNA helicase RecG [Metallococcus carri]NOP36692.1 ATP-dependent DNA helicase RecG [Calidifontibacter sp. DB2511S]